MLECAGFQQRAADVIQPKTLTKVMKLFGRFHRLVLLSYIVSVTAKLFRADIVIADTTGRKHLPHRGDHSCRSGTVVDRTLQLRYPFRQHLWIDKTALTSPREP